ncbi:RHS repeat-associated core domain-containing protein [Sorangium sp. So ce185]
MTPDAGPVEAVLPEVGTSLDLPTGRLIRLRDGFILQAPDRRAYFFGPASSSPSRFNLLRVSDTNGNAIRLTYRQDALDTITDSVGRLVRARRSSGGRILCFEVMRASHGGWTRFRAYEYNDAGDLVRATDASGQAETYVYGADHLLVTQLSATGLTVHYKYDEFGRCVESFALRAAGDSGLADDVPATLADRQTAAKGFLHVRLNYYDDFSEVITSRSIRRVEGNAQSRVERMTWGSWVHTQRCDEAGRILSYTDSTLATYAQSFDAEGRLLRVTDPLGRVTEHRYDDGGLLAETTYSDGRTIAYERDDAGNLTVVSDDAGIVSAVLRDARGLPVEASLPDGALTHMRYDQHGNRTEVHEPDGTARRIYYDDLGRPLGYVDTTGSEVRYFHDECGRLRSVRHPGGGVVRYDYDADGNLTRIVDADGRATELVYGGYHRVIRVVRPDGATVRYAYDREQDLVLVINEAGHEHRIVRQGEGRIVAEHTFDGRSIAYRHDPMGRIVRIDRGLNDRTDFVYDALGRMIERHHSSDEHEAYEYDEPGRIVRATAGGVISEFRYDVRGNLIEQATRFDGRTFTVKAEYDSRGRRTGTAVEGLPGSTTRRIEVARDQRGFVSKVLVDHAHAVDFVFDAAGREAARVLPNGGAIEWTYDGAGTVQSLAVRGVPRAARSPAEPPLVDGDLGSRHALRQSFQWSLGGSLVVRFDAELGTAEYDYDTRGRLARIRDQQGTLESYGFGVAGERYDFGRPDPRREYAPGGRLVRDGDAVYTYDHCGRLTRRTTGGSDPAATWTYAWSAAGLLQRASSGDLRVVLTHDAFARRVDKRVFRNGALVTRTRYIWDERRLLGSLEESEQGTMIREYLYMADANEPIAQRVSSLEKEGSWEYFIPDAFGLVPLGVASAAGQLLGRFRANQLGALSPAAGAETELRLPGQIYDPELGLADNGFRIYDPSTGLFLSPEPLGLEASLQPYAYADNEAPWAYDPDGLARMRSRATSSQGGSIVTTSGANGSVSVNDGPARPRRPMHPAVAAALPIRAREEPLEVAQCADPWAYSEHLWEYENRTGQTCDPATPEGSRNLRGALREMSSYGATQSDERRSPCPNCSQTISRLHALAGMGPPRAQVQNGRGLPETPRNHGNPANMVPGARRDGTVGAYEGMDANSPLAAAGPAGAQANQARYRAAVQAAQQAPRGSGPSAQDQAARRRRWAGADPNASVPNAGVFGHDDQGRWQRQDQSPNAPPRQS